MSKTRKTIPPYEIFRKFTLEQFIEYRKRQLDRFAEEVENKDPTDEVDWFNRENDWLLTFKGDEDYDKDEWDSTED